MRKMFLPIIVITVFAFLLAGCENNFNPVDQNSNNGVSLSKKSGNSDVYHFDLLPQDGSNSYGQVQFRLGEGNEVTFVLNAFNLTPKTEYNLKSSGNVYATGVSNNGGNLHLQGTFVFQNGARFNIRLASNNTLIIRTDVINLP